MGNSSFEEHKITNPWERYLLTSYLLIVLLSSLIGDTIILIASVRYNAVKLNKFLVIVMQHIAVCDLLLAISFIFPTIVSLIWDRWIFATVGGSIRYLVYSACARSNNILVCVLTTSKLLILKFPLRTRNWDENKGHCVCFLAWFVTIAVAGIFHFSSGYRYEFDYIYYAVSGYVTSKTADKFNSAVNVISYIVPMFTIIFSTALILHHLLRARKISQRVGGTLRWQGMVTVAATATVFSVSIIPGTVLYFLFMIKGGEILSFSMFVRVSRVSYFMSALNIMSNFYIYSLTVLSFRKFIKLKVSLFMEKLTHCLPAQKVGPDPTRSDNKPQCDTLPVTVEATGSLCT